MGEPDSNRIKIMVPLFQRLLPKLGTQDPKWSLQSSRFPSIRYLKILLVLLCLLCQGRPRIVTHSTSISYHSFALRPLFLMKTSTSLSIFKTVHSSRPFASHQLRIVSFESLFWQAGLKTIWFDGFLKTILGWPVDLESCPKPKEWSSWALDWESMG